MTKTRKQIIGLLIILLCVTLVATASITFKSYAVAEIVCDSIASNTENVDGMVTMNSGEISDNHTSSLNIGDSALGGGIITQNSATGEAPSSNKPATSDKSESKTPSYHSNNYNYLIWIIMLIVILILVVIAILMVYNDTKKK